MRISRRLTGIVAGVALLGGTVAAAPAAQAGGMGTTPLAAVLTSDGNTFDGNWADFDIVTQAVLAVLDAKPGSPVGALTDGDVALTAFIPKDSAFRLLVKDLTGTAPKTEQATFEAVAGLGIDTVETVLLYHVVLGAPIDSSTALGASGAVLTTAQGGTLRVKVGGKPTVIRLVDADPSDWNAKVAKPDLNKGNKQIAHGINAVLRPLDLP